IAVITNSRLFQTTIYRHRQEFISPDQPRHSGPEERDPQRTSPTREKPLSEGHAIDKAKDVLGVMKDTAVSATEKVKDVFTRMTSPALDVQSEAAAKGLKDHTQQLKDKGQKNLENAKDKGYDAMENMKDKGRENLEYAKDKGYDAMESYDTMESIKEKGQNLADKALEVDSSSEKSDRQRESKERLANPEPGRHPKGPVEEIKQSVRDVADTTKQTHKNY
ncbi:7598_t:CDS:2, partial [Dentiscutata heterogama]